MRYGTFALSMLFQSTLSVRRATFFDTIASQLKLISIHALRKESDVHNVAELDYEDISIHALRKESDLSNHSAIRFKHISIHALRKESDGLRKRCMKSHARFQSTLSVRRATA